MTSDKGQISDQLSTFSIWKKAFSFPALLGALLVLGAFLVARAFRFDSDTWWHLVVGERILATHSWPTSDIYSFTAAGTEWIAYEWLGEVVIAGFLLYSLGPEQRVFIDADAYPAVFSDYLHIMRLDAEAPKLLRKIRCPIVSDPAQKPSLYIPEGIPWVGAGVRGLAERAVRKEARSPKPEAWSKMT